MTNGAYRPHPKTTDMPRRAFEHVRSVEYSVSARWLFYRLLQDGTFTGKDDYKAVFLPALSTARKRFFEGWAPNTLADDTREPNYRGFGYRTVKGWLAAISRQGRERELDRWASQPNYVEPWFEAAAMSAQFEHYTEHVTLGPFKGDIGIPAKWEIAKTLDSVAEHYPDTPITALYFGDLDLKGLQIPESAVADTRKWTSADFDFIRRGLNPGDEGRFDLPENFEKPGTYRWEALDDDDARTPIEEHVNRYLDDDAFEAVAAREAKESARFRDEMAALAGRW